MSPVRRCRSIVVVNPTWGGGSVRLHAGKRPINTYLKAGRVSLEVAHSLLSFEACAYVCTHITIETQPSIRSTCARPAATLVSLLLIYPSRHVLLQSTKERGTVCDPNFRSAMPHEASCAENSLILNIGARFSTCMQGPYYSRVHDRPVASVRVNKYIWR